VSDFDSMDSLPPLPDPKAPLTPEQTELKARNLFRIMAAAGHSTAREVARVQTCGNEAKRRCTMAYALGHADGIEMLTIPKVGYEEERRLLVEAVAAIREALKEAEKTPQQN
jgi:hypothetical protein